MADTWTGKQIVAYNPLTRKLETVPDLGADQIDDDAIDTPAIEDGSVSNAKLEDGAVTAAKLAADVNSNSTTIAAAAEAALNPATSGAIALVIADAAETNTLAVPQFVGQELTIAVKSRAGSGSRAITVASAFNITGNTILTFDAAGEYAVLRAYELGAVLAWKLGSYEGATPSTP